MRIGNRGLNQLGPTAGDLRAAAKRQRVPWRGNPKVAKRNAKLRRLMQAGKLKPQSKAQMREQAERALLAWRRRAQSPA